MSRLCWRRRFSHRFEHSAQITVGGDDSGSVFLERGTHDIEAAQEAFRQAILRESDLGFRRPPSSAKCS